MKRLNISITKPGSITQAIKQLEEYRDSVNAKTTLFIEKLLHEAQITAELNCGEYGGYITFSKVLNPSIDGCVGLFIATDAQKIVRVWQYQGGFKSAEVSPLLMSEFGSGWLSQVKFPEMKGIVGQGTFPGGTHAFDPHGWFWKDEDGIKHHSIGEEPTYPMYSAMMAVMYSIDEKAREVFKNG